jgi:hypothetical protein
VCVCVCVRVRVRVRVHNACVLTTKCNAAESIMKYKKIKINQRRSAVAGESRAHCDIAQLLKLWMRHHGPFRFSKYDLKA